MDIARQRISINVPFLFFSFLYFLFSLFGFFLFLSFYSSCQSKRGEVLYSVVIWICISKLCIL